MEETSNPSKLWNFWWLTTASSILLDLFPISQTNLTPGNKEERRDRAHTFHQAGKCQTQIEVSLLQNGYVIARDAPPEPLQGN